MFFVLVMCIRARLRLPGQQRRVLLAGHRTVARFCLAAAALLGPASGHAQTKDYTGANNQAWATAGNWNPGGVPGSSDSVTVTNGNTVRIQSATAAVASSITLGGALTGAIAMIDTTTNSLTVGGNITLAPGAGNGILFLRKANNTVTLNGGTGSILNGGGAGTASLNLEDGFSGSLSLLNANPDDIVMGQQPGTVTLNINGSQTYNVARLLYLNHASAGASAATINLNGGTLNVGSELRLNSGTNAGNTSYLNINGGGRFTALSIRRSNAGSNAVINWNDGTIANYAGGNLTLQTTVGAGNLTLVLAGTGTHTFEAESGRTITVAATAVLADKAGENGTLRKTGAGSLVFQSTNTYTGLTTVDNGTLVTTNAGWSATIGSDSITVQFASAPALGTYPILAGPIAAGSLASQSVTVAGGGAIGNAILTNSPHLAVVVGTAPVMTGATNASGVVGQPFSYQISASNNPTSYAATGLPAGLSVNTQTGLISGEPTVATLFGSFTVTAVNAFGAASQSVMVQLAHTSEVALGDSSNVPETPSVLGTVFNGQTVLGSVGGSDTDDYLTFSVPDGYRLQSMRLRLYSAPDAGGSVAIAGGASWTAGENTSGLLGFASFGPADVGADLLATMKVSGSALGAGSYTMRLRRAGAEAAYGFDFKLVAVGAPSGEITATPSTVFLIPGQLGATTISWTTSGCANARVTVSTESNPSPGNFAQGTSSAGSSAPWISEGRVFFRLYGDLSATLLLDEVVVTGRNSPLRVAGVFGNNMVLQRDAEVPVWGWADPGQTVQVGFAGQNKSAVAGPDGKWIVRLDPMPASETGRAMQISNGISTMTLTDIVVGEVWLLSGQSNMAMRIDDIPDAGAVARADYPWLRTFGIGWPFGSEQQPNLAPYRTQPATDVAAGSSWSRTSPANAGGCYAVGFYFAEALRQSLGPGIPIGLMQVAVGSTWGECWVGQATRDANPALHYIGTSLWTSPPGNPWFADKYVMYHGLIAPLQPYRIRGALWYQGEGNTDLSVVHYRDLLSGLIEGWRDDWGQGDFPFFIVQLPAYGGTKDPWHSYELLREAQLQVSRATANTGLAVTIDTGGTADPHPVDKQPVGERLARLARAQVYGQAITPTGPIYAGGTADAASVNLRFDHAGSGLQSVGGALRTFEAAGADGVFHPATATITAADTVRVTCTEVPAIVEVRYGWDWNPDCNLFNSEMLPASPFRAAMDGSLAASPSKITVSPGTTGSSAITWETNLSPGAHVTRASAGGPESEVGAASAGGVTVSGLGAGKTIFRLYGDASRTRLLDTIEIIGTVSPLTVQADGTLRLDNRPFSATGVNYFDAMGRTLWPAQQTSYDEGFRRLGEWGIPFARFDLTGYQPIYAGLFFTDRAEYFRRLDGVVASAERHGVGLIPSFFWAYFTFSDLAGERLDQLGVSSSLTRQKMREFATEIVNRYKHSRAIWAWEFGNEWNLMVDLPNAASFLPPTWTDLGNPPNRDPQRDIVTTDIVLAAMQEFADLVHQLDPGRPISTGHSMPRTAAWHMDQWQRGLLPIEKVWTDDSSAQAAAIAARLNPPPFDLLSIHVYDSGAARVPDYARIASGAGQALFVGEFGAGDRSSYQSLLQACAAAPLRAMWSYDSLERPDDPMVATVSNSRSYMLRDIMPAGFSSWSRGRGRGEITGPAGETAFHEYLFGAPRPGAGTPRAAGQISGNLLSLEATVRTNDPTAHAWAESTTDLVSTNWTTNNLSWSPAADQSSVLPGCERRVFSVPIGTDNKEFLRIKAQSP